MGGSVHQRLELEPGMERLKQEERMELQAGKGLKEEEYWKMGGGQYKGQPMGKNIQRNKVDWIHYNFKVPAREGQCKLVERERHEESSGQSDFNWHQHARWT